MMNLPSQRIDGLGRILLPKGLREGLGWECGDVLSIRKEGGKLILQLLVQQPDPQCAYCGRPDRAVSVNGKDICDSCLEGIAEALEVQARD